MLVVFAHHSLPIALDTYIFSFHMPLFFFISGFLFDFGKYAESAGNFVKGRFRSLIVPYFSFAVLTCLFYFLLDTAFQPGVTNIEFFRNSALYGIYSIIYALGPLVSYNPPLWFLTCLFVTEILFYGLAKTITESRERLYSGLLPPGCWGIFIQFTCLSGFPGMLMLPSLQLYFTEPEIYSENIPDLKNLQNRQQSQNQVRKWTQVQPESWI